MGSVTSANYPERQFDSRADCKIPFKPLLPLLEIKALQASYINCVSLLWGPFLLPLIDPEDGQTDLAFSIHINILTALTEYIVLLNVEERVLFVFLNLYFVNLTMGLFLHSF